jgi:hypothetical protein
MKALDPSMTQLCGTAKYPNTCVGLLCGACEKYQALPDTGHIA